jgi:1-acyl-sn-glycerol-3-phosphate acyltransferase
MMKRYSKTAIAKNPALEDRDIIEAKRACQNLLDKPFTLLNFIEGTRFTQKKRDFKNDLRFILDDPKKEEEEINKKNKRDFKNDILKVSAGIPSIIPSLKESIREKSSHSQKWSWSEFINPARNDNLHLKHWQRVEDIKKDYDSLVSIPNINKLIQEVNQEKENKQKILLLGSFINKIKSTLK